MTAETTDPQLRRNSLGLPELVFQGVTHIAPATNIVFTFPIIALKAGPDMPLSFLLSTVVCFFIGNTVSQFSRYMPSSGGYYSFATRGLGSRSGFMATWSYLIYEILGAAGSTGFLGYLISDMLQMQFHVNIPWWLLALATTALIWALTHHGVQLSARITALLGGLELLIMLALGDHVPDPSRTWFHLPRAAKPSSSPHHFGGILAGMVFSILALSGFEAPAPLAQEARLPGKFIGQAIMLSLWQYRRLLHPYFLCERDRLGHRRHGRLRLQSQSVLRSGPCALGCGLVVRCPRHHQQRRRRRSRLHQRCVARDVHDGSRGHAPGQFRAHPSHPSDTHIRDRLCADVGMAAILLVGLLLQPDIIFGFLETIATLAVIVLYGMANLALTRYMRREQPEPISRFGSTWWFHGSRPWLCFPSSLSPSTRNLRGPTT